MPKENKRPTIFLIDDSVLKEMLEGEAKGSELLDKLLAMNRDSGGCPGHTTMACFLRAIWLTDDKASIKKVKEIMEAIRITPSLADYKDEEAVKMELISIANMASGEPRNWRVMGG